MSNRVPTRRVVRSVLYGAALCCGLAIGNGVRAEATAPAQSVDVFGATHDFHIKPQPLDAALEQFTAETKVHVGHPAALTTGKTTPDFDGNYSVLELLTRLLAGTGLVFKQADQGLVLVAAEAAPAHGDATPPDPALKNAWDKFAATMAQLRTETENTPVFQAEPWNRAKGYHTLMEAQAMAYNFAIMPRLDYPRIQEATAWQVNDYTLGQNGPDSLYGNILLDGRQTYKITGRFGAVKLTLMQVFSHIVGVKDSKLIGNYDLADFKTGPDGILFEITLSATKSPGNWIPLDANSSENWIMIRRWIGDWNGDPGEMHIQMTSTPAPGFYDYEEFDSAAMAKRIDDAADVAKYLVESFNIGLYEMYLTASGGEKNHMALLPGTATSQMGSPTSKYVLGTFDIKEDEALIVELDQVPTDAAYWSFQLGDVWSRSLDFLNRQTSINMAGAAIDSDGKVRVVVSRQDPGIANWLDTTDHQDGTLVFRNYRSKIVTLPTVQKVKFADLAKYLPKDVRRITPEQREAVIDKRRQGIMKAYNGVF